jgi:UDP-N-acetylmuramoyl-tripeptide--D-alanyl-D-alanine ligase
VVGDPAQAWRAIAAANRRRFPGPIIGVTGSVGKTSTKELLRTILGPTAWATQANENNLLGVPLTLCGIDPVAHQFGVIEAGISERGEMAELAKMIQPDVALITLIAPAHLEKLGSVEGVAHEKAKLAQAVRPGVSLRRQRWWRQRTGPCLRARPHGFFCIAPIGIRPQAGSSSFLKRAAWRTSGICRRP